MEICKPHGRLLAMSINSANLNAVQEDYILIEGERIFIRIEPPPFGSGLRGRITLAVAPPRFGNPNVPGKKWRSGESPLLVTDWLPTRLH